ncbi:OmpA family protein [Burkholderia stagnalis]
MNKLALALALSATALAACTTSSGLTYTASELQPRDGVRTFEVSCLSLTTGPQTCMKAAQKICGDQPVRVLDSARSLRDGANPTSLVFQCGAAPAAPAEPVPAAEPAAAVEHVNLSGDALFATDQATLAPTARESLDKLLSDHADHTYSQVTVTGYTDSVGSDSYNLALSKRRAEAVASYLKSHGMKADTLTVTGRGKADPVASNATAEGRANNRRVEISLQR